MAGHNKIRMTDLEDMFKVSGFLDAETYIQSGNVIFSGDGELSDMELTAKIESEIRTRFGYSITALLRSLIDLEKIAAFNPFMARNDFDPAKSAVIFLNEKPSEEQLEKVKNVDYPPDKFQIIGKEIFIYCPHGFGKTKLYTNFFEKMMKVSGTARNWNSVNTILTMAERKKGL
jgi:uncharacterized protein (DUF1697 family)